MPKEFEKFCYDRGVDINEYEGELAKEAWNEAIKISSNVVAEMEGVDYGISEDYTVVDK